MNKKLAETLTGIARPSWLRSVLNEAPQPKKAPPAPPPEEEAPPEDAPPEDAAPPEEAPPEDAPPADPAAQAPPPDQGAAPPPDQQPPPDAAPPDDQPPVGGNQADPSEQPTPPVRPFQNDGLDKLNVDGTPKTSPNRYRQPGPGDQEAIKRFLKKNKNATDDDLHTFLRGLGIDPQEGEKTVMKLARAAREEAVSPLIRDAVSLFLDERECDSKGTNKPWRTSGGSKKFAVCGKEGGETKLVRFGDPNLEIKRDSPERRKNFRARHGCDAPGPKTKAKCWACKTWEKGKTVSDVVESFVGLFLNERKDMIPGGKGDKLDEKDVDPEQLRMGIGVELEHTKNKALAKEIALDHLAEDPRYYTMMKKIHKESIDTPWRDQKYGGSIGKEPARFWNVGKIHDWAQKHYPAKPLALKHLAHIFKPGSGTVAKEPFGSKEFKARADRAVMHPIMVALLPDGSHDVIDGTHRTHEALANGDDHIQAHVIPWDKLPESARTDAHAHESVQGLHIITDGVPEQDGVAPEESVTPDQKDPRTGDTEVGCLIVLPLPLDLARQFPRMIGPKKCETPPHVTVLHVGELSPSDYRTMIDVVQRVVANYQPFFMDMHGADVFDDNKDYDVLYANTTSRTFRAYDKGVFPTLNVLHADLRKALEDAGIDVKHDYGKNKGVKNAYAERYMPHATIAYIPKGEQCLVRPPTGSWFALDIECWGWEKIQLQLGKTVMDQPAFRR